MHHHQISQLDEIDGQLAQLAQRLNAEIDKQNRAPNPVCMEACVYVRKSCVPVVGAGGVTHALTSMRRLRRVHMRRIHHLLARSYLM